MLCAGITVAPMFAGGAEDFVMALSTNQQASLWFAIIITVALVGFGWLYYFESAERAVDTDGKMYREAPLTPRPERRDTDLVKPATPPVEAAPR
jgi:hypothetical protein